MYKYCNNCFKSGHLFKQCRQPITSYGFIVFHRGINNDEPIQFLIINRKHSICFIEFIRGRYIYMKNNKPVIDLKYIDYLFRNMTIKERARLITESFDDLWTELWSIDHKKHKQEYINSRVKYDTFKKGMILKDKTISLESILSETTSSFETPEWGFPKGRKTKEESDLECAYREFQEETDLNGIECLDLISEKPLYETYKGFNSKMYRGIYYLAKFKSLNPEKYKKLEKNPCNLHQNSEIMSLKWLQLEDALNYIREYHSTRKKILNMANQYIKLVHYDKKGPVKLENFINEKDPVSSEDEYELGNILPNINNFDDD